MFIPYLFSDLLSFVIPSAPSLLSPVAHSAHPGRSWPLGRLQVPERPARPCFFSDPGCGLLAAPWPFHQGSPSGSKRKVGFQNLHAFPMCLAWCVQAGDWLVRQGALEARDGLGMCVCLGAGENDQGASDFTFLSGWGSCAVSCSSLELHL